MRSARVYFSLFVMGILFFQSFIGCRALTADALYAQQKIIERRMYNQQRMTTSLLYGGCAVATIFLLYTAYNTLHAASFFEEHKHALLAHIHHVKGQQSAYKQDTFWYKSIEWLVKTGGGIVIQSMVMRMLEPFYGLVKSYVTAEVPVVAHNFWFLTDTSHPITAQGIVMLKDDIALFVMHAQALDMACGDDDGDLLYNAALYIMAHMQAVKEKTICYERVVVEKVYRQLENIFYQLLSDDTSKTRDKIDVARLLGESKESLAQLHRVSYYNQS